MIATKPKPASAPVEASFEPAETAPLLEYDSPSQASALPESLFYGLSFPEVPTDVPTITPPARAAALPAKVKKPAAEPAEEKSFISSTQERPSSVKQQVARERDISADLSALYMSMEAPADKVYPSLPDVMIQSPPPVYEQTTHRHSEVSYSQRSQPASSTQQAQSGPGAERLVQELLDENAKLAQEVEDLRASLRVISEENSMESEMARAARERVGSSSSEEEEASEPVVRATPPSAAPVADSSNGRLKYVCCGSCNQWLQAPIDKTYVYCPQCGSVNDCSSAERRNPQQTPAPAARRLANVPWYQQCFVRLSELAS